MIISVSRRTDIPAFYTEWFFNRLKEGYVLVRNPMNNNQISKVSLKPEDVDCFVFWTKNPKNIMNHIHQLEHYHYYFQVSINPYDKTIETGVPKKKEIIHHFNDLSKKVGKEKVIWRYDPILLSDTIDIAYHFKYFDYMASQLENTTNKCVISFLDLYAKTKRNMSDVHLKEITPDDMKRLAKGLAEIAKGYKITIETCAEAIDLGAFGIQHGKCIDDQLIADIIGYSATIPKDTHQREDCGCVKSIDIGAYHTCPHGCIYCYANTNPQSALHNYEAHDPASPLLFGQIKGNEKITERKVERYFSDTQIKLL
ncbi:DUF1848 domain-containing protein [Vallitalea pronyensis]|uniref:DUF1848 domain-containing protein n=1 Tax=Vallitalea pronyensis TaxID=1348613 RepID=A0A8J8MHP5_9FIRM|nr:DUF1848 domain-containing protein [Vallitalea pronyensis]QUI21819.1 DUF1848 domain-containing protein [Vallitalea pronyensis]